MRLLQLVARNHRSFRDELFLDLTRPTFRTNLPSSGKSWSDCIYPVAATFGANASGKSNVLSAIQYITSALYGSSASWLKHSEMPRDPFKLDSSINGPSLYSIDFLLSGREVRNADFAGERRFHYEFTVSPSGIEHELLQTYLSTRPSTIFERTADTTRVKLSKQHGGSFDVSVRELALSRARVIHHPYLAPLTNAILAGCDSFDVGDGERRSRIARLTREIVEGKVSPETLVRLAQAADIGITGAFVDEEELPPELIQFLNYLQSAQEKDSNNATDTETHSSRENHDPSQHHTLLGHSLRFHHGGGNKDKDRAFTLGDESDGTITWLALAIPVLRALQRGSLLCVDELDTSLHPYLAAAIVHLFQDPNSNLRGAQLIFTTHDASLLGPQATLQLERQQIWLTEKRLDGTSELYSLADFSDIKARSNIAKQFLEGRYGGIPRLAMSALTALVHQGIDDNIVE
ncbi:AAA family ATPase [Schaalia suimastitidis]|uniref:AAA family ATPase n=1 Tax=Schaalia suimastitidis TaxID=121163 RepID=UPI00047D0C3E|nr:ATP-binding protein [Schaalia suimastitidis]